MPKKGISAAKAPVNIFLYLRTGPESEKSPPLPTREKHCVILAPAPKCTNFERTAISDSATTGFSIWSANSVILGEHDCYVVVPKTLRNDTYTLISNFKYFGHGYTS